MNTSEKLKKYRKLNEVEKERFLKRYRYDKRFVSLVQLGDALMEGFEKYLRDRIER